MSLDAFMQQFGGAEVAIQTLPTAAYDDTVSPFTLDDDASALDAFVEQFNGVTEPYYFYYVNGEPTVELRFQTAEHIYYLVGELGQLTAQDGVTTICHIIDKSNALVPWSAKVCIEKLLRTIPTIEREECIVTDPMDKDYIKAGSPTHPAKYIPEMAWEAFTKIAYEAKSAHKDVLTDAGDIGHMAHTWLEYFIKAMLAGFEKEVESKLLNLPADERAANCVRAALDWIERHQVKFIETERKIYSKKYGYAGTMDGLALVSSCGDPGCCPSPFKDRLSIIDWKSSNYLYTEYLYQTAAYENAYEEEFKVEVEDRWIIRLGKVDGEFETWHCQAEDFQEDIEGFLDALSLTRSVKLTTERMKGQKKARKEVRKKLKEEAKEAEKAQRKQARADLVAERRAQKALEKEVLREAKKAERRALKAGVPATIVEACRDTAKADALLDKIVPLEEECDCDKGTFCIVHGEQPTITQAMIEAKLDPLAYLRSQLPQEN